MSKICLLLMRLLWLVCTVCRSFLTILWFPFPLWLALFGVGPCLTMDFVFLQPTLFSCYHLLPYHFIILAAKLFCLNLVGPLWDCCLFFSQWPSTAIGSFVISLVGSCVPFIFSWASQTRLLSLGFLGHFLNFAFSWAFTEFFGFP